MKNNSTIFDSFILLMKKIYNLMPGSKNKIFLSYAREDLSIAKKVYNDLNRYDLKVWFDMESPLPGQLWEAKIKNAIKNSDRFLVLLSKNSLCEKSYVKIELQIAFKANESKQSKDDFIIPARLENCGITDERLRQIQYVDVFPERQYEKGFDKILKSINPQMFMLRSQAIDLSVQDAINMIRSHGFYDKNKNPIGKAFPDNFEVKTQNGDKIIMDKLTGLIWQQEGSSNEMVLSDADKYIKDLNSKRYAGNHFWRLPTLEEAMSILKSEKSRFGVYCYTSFNFEQWHIWTFDLEKSGLRSKAWMVDFSQGLCNNEHLDMKHYVRAVFSG